MISSEIFYLHIQGQQRGPYTLVQIDHLLNSGLITNETLYWREGLDQWQPVTGLVVVRETKKRSWLKPGIILGCALLFLAALVRFFGPITLIGWRETNQHDYTERAAYWRAREVIRTAELQKKNLVEFGKFSEANIRLQPPYDALVNLPGEVTDAGGETRGTAWQAAMHFNPRSREWTGAVQK